jgi:nucleoid-associated protein EbfC
LAFPSEASDGPHSERSAFRYADLRLIDEWAWVHALHLPPARAYLTRMKDLNALMQQAQAMQQKLQDAQAKMAETTAEGTSGGGLVTVALKGPGEITAVRIDDSLMVPGEGEILADLIVAAHADAKRKLDAVNAELMREAAGPMAGLNIPGMPKLF